MGLFLALVGGVVCIRSRSGRDSLEYSIYCFLFSRTSSSHLLIQKMNKNIVLWVVIVVILAYASSLIFVYNTGNSCSTEQLDTLTPTQPAQPAQPSHQKTQPQNTSKGDPRVQEACIISDNSYKTRKREVFHDGHIMKQVVDNHVQEYLAQSNYSNSLGSVPHWCENNDTSSTSLMTIRTSLTRSICLTNLWKQRNSDPDHDYSLDSSRCISVLDEPGSSVVDCIQGKRMPRNCKLDVHRFCVVQNATFLVTSNSRKLVYHRGSRLVADTKNEENSVRYCMGTEVGGGYDPPGIIDESQSVFNDSVCTKVVNRTTFFYHRYAKHGHRYHIYHSLHGTLLSLFATIMDAAPELFDEKTMTMRKDRIQIAHAAQLKDWDDSETPESLVLSLFTDSPVTTMAEVLNQSSATCFRKIVVGVSNRLYLERRVEVGQEYSGTKRRYTRLFSEFVRSNLPSPTEEELSAPHLADWKEGEPRVFIASRGKGPIIAGRSILNIEAIQNYFSDPSKYKYAKYIHFVDFGGMSPRVQLHTLSRPGTIYAGMFGAGFAHLAWMNPKGSTAILWKSEALHNNLYHILSSLAGIRFRTLSMHREECIPHSSSFKQFSYDQLVTAELIKGTEPKLFEYTRDMSCMIDMEKLEVYLNEAVEYALNYLNCKKQGLTGVTYQRY